MQFDIKPKEVTSIKTSRLKKSSIDTPSTACCKCAAESILCTKALSISSQSYLNCFSIVPSSSLFFPLHKTYP
jgi:hypothetical protein